MIQWLEWKGITLVWAAAKQCKGVKLVGVQRTIRNAMNIDTGYQHRIAWG